MFVDSNKDLRVKYDNTIRKEIDHGSGAYTYYPVVIIGAGESGIAAGCRLREELGFDQFRIFERQSGIGGSWWINRYPGVACSNAAIFDTYSFCVYNEQASTPPTASEILENLQNLCQKYRIVDKIQLNTEVRECQWLESEQVWELTLWHVIDKAGDLSEYDRTQKVQNDGRESVYSFEEKIRVRILVNAVGFTMEPKQLLEDVPGREKFRGEIFHSTRWRYDVDLTDKEIIVMGTDNSTTRFMPLLINDYAAQSVTQLMRSPSWIIPLDHFSANVHSRWHRLSLWLTRHVPRFGMFIRSCVAAGSENNWRLFGPSGCNQKQRRNLETEFLRHMKKIVPRRYHEILTPDHEFGCKPWVVDSAWLSSLKNPAVTLTTLPISSIAETDVTLGPGRLYPDPKDTTSRAPNHQVTIPADVIILANEFDTSACLYPLDVTGRSGKKLHDRFNMKRDSQMYTGVALDGFPNYFTLLSPNTVNGNFSTILASENTLNLCLRFIKPLLVDEFSIVELKQEAEHRWAKETQNALEKVISKTSFCDSLYYDESRRCLLLYPYSQIWFTLFSMFPIWSDWNITYTRKGQIKNLIRKALNAVALTATVWGILKIRKNNSILSVKNLIQVFLFTSSKILYNLASSINIEN